MSQRKSASLLEAMLNVGSGYLVAVAVQSVAYPWFGIRTTLGQDASLALIFTGTSLVRSYCWRRVFNAL